MAVTQLGKEWTKRDLVKSILYFFLHFVILVTIGAILLLWDKFDILAEHMRQVGAGYLYALFCVFMLVIITYLYYFFEDRAILSSGKNIALIFMLLDLSFIVSWLIGAYIDIFARPVAFVALMAFVLIGRRSGIFLNIISALLLFIVDTFAGGISVENAYFT